MIWSTQAIRELPDHSRILELNSVQAPESNPNKPDIMGSYAPG